MTEMDKPEPSLFVQSCMRCRHCPTVSYDVRAGLIEWAISCQCTSLSMTGDDPERCVETWNGIQEKELDESL